jgi:MFS transporter, DHA1 family, staphyloferrin A biosynthesis exporter
MGIVKDTINRSNTGVPVTSCSRKRYRLNIAERTRNLAAALGVRTLSSLRNPVFRLYFFGMLGQFAAMNMQTATAALLIYRLTDSSALLGTMSLANAGPMIVISLFGGAIADRLQKKNILIIGLLCSGAVALGVALALDTGMLSKEHAGSWWILIVSSFLQGTIMGLMLPARQAIIPEIVSREQTMNAVSLNMLGMNVLSLIAPGIAGFMIDAINFESVYYTMAGLYVYGAIFILFVPHTSQVNKGSGNITKDILEGLGYIRKDKTILFVLVFTLVVVVLSMPYQQLLPIYVDDILHVGATGMGVLMSVSGAGAMAGSLVMATLPSKKRGVLLLISGLISGVSLIIFAFSSLWMLSLVIIVFMGLGQTIRGTIGSALLQSYTEPRYMGRVMSILMIQWGVMSLCTFFAGVLAEVMPVQWVVGGLAIILLIIAGLAFFFVPRIRKLD